MRIRFWGVRGTIPSPGPDTVWVGANTACLDVYTSDHQIIILDAGTGIRRLGKALMKEYYPGRIIATILISHTHWDHIQGFPFFGPLVQKVKRSFCRCRAETGRPTARGNSGQPDYGAVCPVYLP